jgi:hypothetical protein
MTFAGTDATILTKVARTPRRVRAREGVVGHLVQLSRLNDIKPTMVTPHAHPAACMPWFNTKIEAAMLRGQRSLTPPFRTVLANLPHASGKFWTIPPFVLPRIRTEWGAEY